MIWSVSTSLRLRGTTVPVILRTGSTGLPQIRRGGEHTGDGRRRSNRGGDEMCAPALALATFEVSIAGRGTALARFELIGIHAKAHRAAGGAPLESGFS